MMTPPNKMKPNAVVPTFVALALIPLFVVGVFVVIFSWHDILAKTTLQQQNDLSRAAAQIANQVKSWKNFVFVLSQRDPSNGELNALFRLYPEARAVRMYSSDGEEVRVLKRTGVIRTSRINMKNIGLREQIWRQRVWHGPAENWPEDRDAVCPVVAAQLSPLNEPAGFIAVDFSLEPMTQILASFPENFSVQEGPARIAGSQLPTTVNQSKHLRPITGLAWTLAFTPSVANLIRPALIMGAQIAGGMLLFGILTFWWGIHVSRKLEKTIAHRERLATIGTMANVISHELRTALSSIKNSAQFLKDHLPNSDPKVAKHLGIIEAEATASTQIMGDILAFSKIKDEKKDLINVNAAVREVLSAVPLTRPMTVKTSLAEDLPPLSLNKTEFKQAVTNIIKNGGEAIGEKGFLSIQTGRNNGHVFISVEDNGCGMAPNVQRKIFEPFFTTKTQGTGLGLAIVKEIVEKNGGKLELASIKDKGTKVTLKFKATQEING